GVMTALWDSEFNVWMDDQARIRIDQLAELHFFVEPVQAGVAQISSRLQQWSEKFGQWHVVEQLARIGTAESVEIAIRLLRELREPESRSEYIVQLISNSSSS